MTIRFIAGLAEIAGAYDGYLLDLWGTLHDGVTALPGAVDCTRRLRALGGKQVVILSNGPRRAAEVAGRTQALGFPAELYDHVMSSGEATWQALTRRDDPWHAKLGPRCLHLGPARDRGMLDGLPVTEVTAPDEADFVLCTGLEDGSDIALFDPLLRNLGSRGVPMVCANPDREVIRGGQREYCAGELAKRYGDLGGSVHYHGKPYAPIYAACAELFDLPAGARILGVGDSLTTDIAGAARAGHDTLLITGGIHTAVLGVEPDQAPASEQLAMLAAELGASPTYACPAFIW